MEQLPALGTAIAQVVLPTYKAYTPLLLKRAEAIKSTPRETFSYGAHPRQQLDVYSPLNGPKPGSKSSVLIFLYGGGFVRGDKIQPGAPDGLVYANLGHYFAERLGFKVVIVDYRLISHGAIFPSGGQDLESAIEWVVKSLNHSSTAPLDIYLMGNSAGGVHVATYLLAPDFEASRLSIVSSQAGRARLRGVVFLSVPFHFERADPERSQVLQAYFGSKVLERCPLGLLKASKQDSSVDKLQGVPVMVLTGTLDPEDEILIPEDDFVSEWRSADSVAPTLTVETMEGHNHISPALALGTGIPEEEAWGQRVLDFFHGISQKST